jgi:hypothetical protein
MTNVNEEKQQETCRVPSFIRGTDKVKRFKMVRRMGIL